MRVKPPIRPRALRPLRLLVGLALAGSLVASCASVDGEASGDSDTAVKVEHGIVGDQPEPGAPREGGMLTMASYTSITSLDPAKTPAMGSTGGTELAAIYDVLMRYDEDEGEFAPQLAESLDVSDDGLVSTLTLRDGVTFSNGDPLDARSVTWSIQRYNDSHGDGAQLWESMVQSVEATGPYTVVFTLRQPWSEFPAMLAAGHGMIVSPRSVAGEDFVPIGAGPFVLDRFAPHEKLELSARRDYWDGPPHLDSIRFVGLAGDSAKVEALNAGDVQLAYLRSPRVIRQARVDDRAGYIQTYPLASVLMVNNSVGRPGGDVRVRRAIAQAIDLDAFNKRVDDGDGLPGAQIFPEWSPLHPDVEGIAYDPDSATQLLDAAKRDGYDGHLSFLGVAAAKSQTTALAVQSMLQAVGFTVTLDLQASVADVIKKLNVDRDYDLSFSGISLPDAAPVNKLTRALRSTSDSNYLNYDNSEMDSLLSRLQSTDAGSAARRELLGELQNLVNDTVPFVALGAAPTFTLWSDRLYGVDPTIDSILLFGNAWIEP